TFFPLFASNLTVRTSLPNWGAMSVGHGGDRTRRAEKVRELCVRCVALQRLLNVRVSIDFGACVSRAGAYSLLFACCVWVAQVAVASLPLGFE
ncbi:hypothetical protein, partial [uncultured Tateyamaria sp.]|uniref:hypothetical protein n=1 Tax=uncultured Tateyamaria sp. TaxID=455651 RepID=UPI0026104191